MSHRLLLSEDQAAALAGVDVAEVRRAYGAGRLPRWRLPGSRTPVYDVRDVARVFALPADVLRALVLPETAPTGNGGTGR